MDRTAFLPLGRAFARDGGDFMRDGRITHVGLGAITVPWY